MEGLWDLAGNHFFEGASFLISACAVLYAALALRVAKRAVVAAEASDLVALKLKARDGKAEAQRSLLRLQAACHEMRSRWNQHHDLHYPKMGERDYRWDDITHILAVESEGRELLKAVEMEMSGLSVMNPKALEDCIQRTDGTVIEIDRLVLKLSPPKPLFV